MSARDATVIARTVSRIVFPLILLTAFALLLQGHNRPGGGFIAGVLTAVAFALLMIIYGFDYIESELLGRETDGAVAAAFTIVTDNSLVFTLGLALAVGSGLVAMVFGLPFLTQTVVFLHDLPVYHELELASAFVFDLGVYLVVVGALLTVLTVVGAE
ncbi:MnhB domain-containing protein [Halococcus sp. IIIV-5B]|uniref:MnhB domain-containing protein n=1 Tax=Halococcus sp. IIIV-5B TaxID=2321230 RepID=UPI000E724FC8|nr:MnhB domain-containing protein [Halococcus sp. IIIV-5B]RJT06524.1 sodium:proton antiporter [Halococcus sp. IIIV-5B]